MNLKLDRQTVLLLLGLLGGGTGVTKVSSDISDIRERVARIEARLDYRSAAQTAPASPAGQMHTAAYRDPDETP